MEDGADEVVMAQRTELRQKVDSRGRQIAPQEETIGYEGWQLICINM